MTGSAPEHEPPNPPRPGADTPPAPAPQARSTRSDLCHMDLHLARGRRTVLAGVIVNALLAVTKLLAGVWGHSQALVADAVESLADVAGSTIVYGGLAIAAKPPDHNHPYGHGRAESLAGLAVGLLLLGAAVLLAVESVRELHAPHRLPSVYTLPVLLVVVLVKETLYRNLLRSVDHTGSTALHADAWHHRSDAITSLAAGVGITIALVGGPGYATADDWAALAACVIIAANGARFLKVAIEELMDVRPEEAFLQTIRESAAGVEGVRGVEKLFARKVGSRYLVDMHLEVDPHITVEAGHRIGHRVKERLVREQPQVADVLIHMEPAGDPRPPDDPAGP